MRLRDEDIRFLQPGSPTRGDAVVVTSDRRRARELRRAGKRVTRLIGVPSIDDAELLVTTGRPAATTYAFGRRAVVSHGVRRIALLVAGRVAGSRWWPELRPTLRIASDVGGLPWPVASVVDEAGLEIDEGYCLWRGTGDDLQRPVFFLFPTTGGPPAWVLRLGRTPGPSAAFDRDAAGIELASAAGPTVAAHVPSLLGRFAPHGHEALLETAAPGHPLCDLLDHRFDAATGEAIVDRIARWCIDVLRSTQGAPGDLAAEVERLRADVLPYSQGAPEALLEGLAALPPVLQHNDLGTWNINATSGDFTVLDWESARRDAMPLWDLAYFLADAYAHLDGAAGPESVDHTVDLFAGRLPRSRRLHAWLDEGARAAGLSDATVGRVVTLGWLHHGTSAAARRRELERRVGGTNAAPTRFTVLAERWASDDDLGWTWTPARLLRGLDG